MCVIYLEEQELVARIFEEGDIEYEQDEPPFPITKSESCLRLYKACKTVFSKAHKIPQSVRLRVAGNSLFSYKQVGSYALRSEYDNIFVFPPLKVGIEIFEKDGKLVSNPHEWENLVLGNYKGPRWEENRIERIKYSFTNIGCIEKLNGDDERFEGHAFLTYLENEGKFLERINEVLSTIEAFLTIVPPEDVRESFCHGLKRITEEEARERGIPITNENIIQP